MSLGLVFDDRPLGSSLLKIKNKGFPENRMYSELRLWLGQPFGGPVLIRIITGIGRNVHSKATRFYFRRVKTRFRRYRSRIRRLYNNISILFVDT